MKRDRLGFLTRWLSSEGRKPLVLRGARQVGKTWLIRELARVERRQLVELNFEKRPDFKSLFSSNDPKEIVANISASLNVKIDASSALLFLDEIQVAPQLLEKLRWFAEEMPELPVVAAGSLLDFTLKQSTFSMPVGRIGYMYLEPLSFEEFLDGVGESELRSYLENFEWETTIPEAIHSQLTRLMKEYLVVGGMPAAVKAWVLEKSPYAIKQIHVDLLTTYRDDFAKYSGRLSTDRLEEILTSVPRQLGRKFVYKNANADIGAVPLKQAVELLATARLCHKIISTSANGLPLGAETNEKFMKMLLLDCGLCSASLGLALDQLQSVDELIMINNGGMAEQLVGQLLRTMTPEYTAPSLYYWQRTKKSADAEVDYIIQHENKIIPIEVKAGTAGKLKSLHQFMQEKQREIAVRVYSDLPKKGVIQMKTISGKPFEYQLLSLPFYLLQQLHRLIKTA